MTNDDRQTGPGYGAEIAHAFLAVSLDIERGYIDRADFDTAYAHYRAARQQHEREPR